MFIKRSGVLIALSIVFLLAAALQACKKESNCDGVSIESEDAALKAFMQQKGINGIKHPRGFYYEILAPGGTAKPSSTSIVYVSYKGTLLNDTQFDAQSNPGATGFALNNTIEGWQIAVPLIGKGGRIKIVLPSALGYNCKGSGTTIPPNSPLYFEISLADFFN